MSPKEIVQFAQLASFENYKILNEKYGFNLLNNTVLLDNKIIKTIPYLYLLPNVYQFKFSFLYAISSNWGRNRIVGEDFYIYSNSRGYLKKRIEKNRFTHNRQDGKIFNIHDLIENIKCIKDKVYLDYKGLIPL